MFLHVLSMIAASMAAGQPAVYGAAMDGGHRGPQFHGRMMMPMRGMGPMHRMGGIVIASKPSYQAAMADDAHRPGFNGRLWMTRPIMGPGHGPYAQVGDELRQAYGAPPGDDTLILARHNQTLQLISPWRAMDSRVFSGLEADRQQWLRDNGYTGGVRTFVNDAYVGHGPMHGPQGMHGDHAVNEPRAVIEIDPTVTKFRKRMRVDIGEYQKALDRAAGVAPTAVIAETTDTAKAAPRVIRIENKDRQAARKAFLRVASR